MALDLSIASGMPLDLSMKRTTAAPALVVAGGCRREGASAGPVRPRAVRFRVRDAPYTSSSSPSISVPRGVQLPARLQLKLGLLMRETAAEVKSSLPPSPRKIRKEIPTTTGSSIRTSREIPSPRYAVPAISRSLLPHAATSPVRADAPPSPLAARGCVWREEEGTTSSRGDQAPSPAAPDTLPLDPRQWQRTDVQNWLHSMTGSQGLGVIPPERFLMNGKALCLMTLEMFNFRVPDGGRALFLDFRGRLAHALALERACED